MGNTDSTTNFILHSISDGMLQKDGTENIKFDPEGIRYQLWNVKADNLVACIKAAKNVNSWTNVCRNSMLPQLAENISNVVNQLVNDGITSISASSSEDGKLIKALLANKQEQSITLSGNDKKGIMDKLANITGGGRQQRQEED